MINALIVDDEPAGAKTLQILLNKYCPAVNILGIALSLKEAEENISALAPDLVFLDISMPFGSGFDLLEKNGSINFEVIFTTAHNEYAIKAIRHNALDYLLKPVQKDELINAVAKCENKIKGSQKEASNYDKIINTIKSLKKKKLPIPMQEGILYIDLDEIVRFEGDRNYTKIHLLDGKKIMSSKTLADYEEMVAEDNFFRVHKTHLINLEYIKMYSKLEGGHLIMTDGAVVDVSKLKRAELLSFLSKR